MGSDIVTLNNDGLVINLRSNKGTTNVANISLEMYIINRAKLLELMDKSNEISSFFGLHDIIAFSCNAGERVHGYRYDGFVRCFDSMEHYIEYSLELLNYKYRQQLFLPEWPIYTVTHDTPPTFYDQGAKFAIVSSPMALKFMAKFKIRSFHGMWLLSQEPKL